MHFMRPRAHATAPCCCERLMAKAPWAMLAIPVLFTVGVAASVWLTLKFVRDTETIALTSVLDEMDDDLTDAERDEIVTRVRQNLFG